MCKNCGPNIHTKKKKIPKRRFQSRGNSIAPIRFTHREASGVFPWLLIGVKELKPLWLMHLWIGRPGYIRKPGGASH